MRDSPPPTPPGLEFGPAWLDLLNQFPGFLLITVGPDHRVAFVNAELAEITRYRNILGRPLAEALPELAGQGFLNIRDEVYRTGQPYRGHGAPFRLQRRPDAEPEEGYIDLLYQPIRGRDGAVQGIIFAGYEITEQKLAEQRVRSLQAELLHISRASAMGAMAITLAHELNQPLAAISNYAAAAQRLVIGGEAGRDQIVAALAEIQVATQRAGEIIRRARDMLAKGRPRNDRFDLAEAVREAVSLGLIDARRLGISWHVDLAPGLVVSGDQIQLQQVLLNLLRNAVEAMSASEPRELEIVSHRVQTHAELSISDTGTGLLPEVRSWLFEPFVSTKEDGLGVGLSISRSIVEGFGGEIWAEDRDGGGTRFCLKLPLAD